MQFAYGFLAAIAFLLLPGFPLGRTVVTTPAGTPASFRGLRGTFVEPHTAPRTLRLLYVHGMGETKEFTARPFTNAIAARLGMTADGDARIEIPPPSLPADSAAPHINERTYTNARGDRLVVHEVVWSPLIYELKQKRLSAEEVQRLPERVRVNGRLKQYLLNERMPDPLLYVGRMGAYIRNAVKQTICTRMLAGRIAGEIGHERCEAVRIDDSVFFTVITESLGSAIAFDAIAELDRDTPASAGESPRVLLQRTASFFMLSNQLALLHLNEPGHAFDETDGERASRFPMEVVTISDPNDVLSYPVPESLAREYPKHRFVNVRTRLAWTLLGGLAAWPNTAHTGARTNRRVIAMIADGWPLTPAHRRTSPALR